MDQDRLSRYFFLGLMLVFIYLTFLMISPFIKYIAMALILTYLMYPIYESLKDRVGYESLSAGIMIFIVVLLLVIPSFLVVRTLVSEASTAVSMLEDDEFLERAQFLDRFGLNEERLEEGASQILSRLGTFIVDSASSLLGSLPQIAIGLFLLFFIMYYGFKEGRGLYEIIEEHIPLKPQHKNKLLKDIHSVSHGVLYGQVLTAVIQGTVGGIGFLIFGVPNPVFWGFIMIILSFLPLLGTPVIWVPAVLFELAANDYTNGIGLLIYSGVLTLNIDNVVRPKLISDRTQIHPVIILIGVLGGLVVFGFSGIVLGPLVMALMITMIKFYVDETYG